MTRLYLTRNAELLIAERAMTAPAVVLGLAAGLSAFLWLRRSRGVASLSGQLGLLAITVPSGLGVVWGCAAASAAIHPALGWAWLGGVLAAVVASSYLAGARRTGRSAALLILLRLAAIAILAGLFFEPTVKLVEHGSRRSRLLVLVDRSGSMRLNDGPNGLSRLDWVKSELCGRRGTPAKLEDEFDVRLYSFADTLEEIDRGALAGLAPDGRSTAFAATVGEACSKTDKLVTAAAIVFTDGIDNSGRDPVDGIARAGLPVFPVAVGSRLRERGGFKDVSVARVDHERFVAANNRSEVVAHVEGVGLNGRRVSLVLKFDGKEQDRQTLALDDLPGSQAVKLAFTPDRKGEFKCSVEAVPEPDEGITDNNVHEFDVIVTEPLVKVLLVEGVVRPEYKYLLRSLQMDPNVSVLALVQVRKGAFNQQGNVKDVNLAGFPSDYDTLRKFDVVIFGDVDRSFFTTEQLRNVQALVESGGGFAMLGGYSSLGPGGYGGTAIDEILPVELGGKEMGQEKDPFVPRLTPDGASHPILSGIAHFFERDEGGGGERLPPLLGLTRVGPPRPGATVLAVHPQRAAKDGRPLVVVAIQKYGRGRTMVFSADTTWRWYLGMRGVGQDTPYVRFWGQALRWLAREEVKTEEEKPGVIAYTDRRLYEPGATVRIYSQVRGRDGQAANNAEVVAHIEGPPGSPATRQIPYIPASAGRYEVDFEPPAPGDYKMRVSASDFKGPVGEAELAFQVGRPNLEFDVLDLNDELLKRLAERTNGRSVTMVGLDGFIQGLEAAEHARRTVTAVSLWGDESIGIFGARTSPWLVLSFLAVTALVTAEWVIRKRKQMV